MASKASSDGISAIHRESALRLLNKTSSKTNPPGDSFIKGFDAHILNALPNIDLALPKSTWSRGDVIEIQGPAASGKTHLLYFWAMTCVLPSRACVRIDNSELRFDVLLGGRNKSVIVCDCDARWDMTRLRTIVMRYIGERLASAVPGSQSVKEGTSLSASELVLNCFKRIHVFRPTSTLSLATTLMSIPMYHTTRMPEETIGMLMIDSISTFYWSDRWVSEQIEKSNSSAPDSTVLRPLRTDVNPLRHVMTAILQLRHLLGIVTFLTNWGLTTIESELPSSVTYFRQHLRAPYPSPFDTKTDAPRAGKFPLNHHLTIPEQGPAPLKVDMSLEALVNYQRQGDVRVRGMVRTVDRSSTLVESEFEFAISEDGVFVS